jgi:hypothetical protein
MSFQKRTLLHRIIYHYKHHYFDIRFYVCRKIHGDILEKKCYLKLQFVTKIITLKGKKLESETYKVALKHVLFYIIKP